MISIFEKTSLFFLLTITVVLCDITNNEVDACNLSDHIKKEIASYGPVAQTIIDSVVHGKYKGLTYKHLDDFIVKFGNRISGSANLEDAIDYMLKKSKEMNLENVHGEEVKVPHWVR